ncbi:hypothetical protein [uncultured Cohaesibacter sp.]|uniref:hypothetical protein n=1 Tax=uncultured Cohaesibacter sp. TaxID=1002546 RepID=UPI00292F8BA2|nr:hypothetical protein [uncultured Cohaesibacter sp.]
MKWQTLLGAMAVCWTILPVSTASAGDNNILILKQQGLGNTISVDQFEATGSQVGGVSFNENTLNLTTTDTAYPQNPEFEIFDYSNSIEMTSALANPVLQIGNDNEATITIEGDGDVVQLEQDSQGFAEGNEANIYVNSGNETPSFGAVLQTGGNNTANLTVNGGLNSGVIFQRGIDNIGNVEVNGTDVDAILVQNGSNNNSTVEASGTSSNYSYTLNASNTTGTVAVSSNGASVSITQSRF